MERKRYARARVRGHADANDPFAVVSARYDRRRDSIEVVFRADVSMVIPRRMIAGLERASVHALQAVEVSPAGDALSWRLLDVDVLILGLIGAAFGKRSV